MYGNTNERSNQLDTSSGPNASNNEFINKNAIELFIAWLEGILFDDSGEFISDEGIESKLKNFEELIGKDFNDQTKNISKCIFEKVKDHNGDPNKNKITKSEFGECDAVKELRENKLKDANEKKLDLNYGELIRHPIFDDEKKYDLSYNRSNLQKNYNISNDDIIIILTPGSRESEIERIYPIMIKTIEILRDKYDYKYKDYHVFTFSNSTTKELVDFITHEYEFEARVIADENEKQKIMSCVNIVLAKSGTNTFEFNIAGLPLVITYTFNWFTNMLAKKMVKVKFANLVNIIANKEIIPEFVLDKANPTLIANQLDKLLKNRQLAKKQVEETKNIIKILGYNSPIKASETGAEKILEIMNE